MVLSFSMQNFSYPAFEMSNLLIDLGKNDQNEISFLKSQFFVYDYVFRQKMVVVLKNEKYSRSQAENFSRRR